MNILFIGFFVSRQQHRKGCIATSYIRSENAMTTARHSPKIFQYYLLFSTPIASAFLFISTTSAPFDAKTVAMAFSSKA